MQAIELWNDWNLQIKAWAERHRDGVTFDYLRIRTEDLVNPETKYDVLQKVRDLFDPSRTWMSRVYLCVT